MRRKALAAILAAVVTLFAGAAWAQSRTMVLAADPALAASGLLGYIVPRFALKHGIRPSVVAAPDPAALAADGAADAVIARQDVADALFATGHASGMRQAFSSLANPEDYAVLVVDAGPDAERARVFVDWLMSEIGQRTVAAFAPDGTPLYQPGAVKRTTAAAPVIDGDAAAGERLALVHCGRCHVVGEKNRMGGIGSTPSFAALRAFPGWQDRFLAFWSENPHPVFTFIDGLTDPPDPARPPHIAPVVITQGEIDAIAAYTATIPPKDLGAPIANR